MLKETLALLTKMKAEDGNKAHIASIDKAITAEENSEKAHNTLKAEHATFKAVSDAVGDRDLGELIGFSDALKDIDLDTAAKVIDLKARADGDSATLAEREAEKVTMQKIIDSGKESIEASKKDSAKSLLLADTKIALSGVVGSTGTFESVLDTIMKQKNSDGSLRVTKGDNGVLYDGKPIADAVEGFRKDYEGAFKPAPEGTNNGGGGNGDQPNKKDSDGSVKSVVAEMFK